MHHIQSLAGNHPKLIQYVCFFQSLGIRDASQSGYAIFTDNPVTPMEHCLQASVKVSYYDCLLQQVLLWRGGFPLGLNISIPFENFSLKLYMSLDCWERFFIFCSATLTIYMYKPFSFFFSYVTSCPSGSRPCAVIAREDWILVELLNSPTRIDCTSKASMIKTLQRKSISWFSR